MTCDRRRVLELLGTGVVGSLAGCSSSGETAGSTVDRTDDEMGTEASTSETTRTTAGGESIDEAAPNGPWNVVGQTPLNHTYDADGSGPGGTFTEAWRWELSAPDEGTVLDATYSTPVSDGESLYFTAGGYYESAETDTSGDAESGGLNRVVALDAATGEREWEVTFAEEGSGWVQRLLSSAVDDGTVVTCAHVVQAFDTETGRRQWTKEDAPLPVGPPVIADGNVFVPSLTNGDGRGLAVYDLADGTEQWTALDRISRNSFVAIADETVFASAFDEVVALNRGDGSEIWRASVGFDSLVRGRGEPGPLHTPVVDDRHVYVAGGFQAAVQRDASGMVAVDRADGAEVWRFEPENAGTQTSYSAVYGLPMLHDETLYVIGGRGDATDGFPEGEYQLYAVDATDGTALWQTAVPGLSTHIVGGNEVVYALSSDQVTAYATADGTQVGTASFAPGTLFSTQPSILSGEMLVSASQDGIVGFGPN